MYEAMNKTKLQHLFSSCAQSLLDGMVCHYSDNGDEIVVPATTINALKVVTLAEFTTL